MSKKSIIILANKYPNQFEPTTNMFIQQLAWAFADMEYECSVICPMPVNINFKYMNLPKSKKEKTENNNIVNVFYPKYISLGQGRGAFQKQRVSFTTKTYEVAVNSILKKMKKKPDYIYAYFLCPASVVASRLGKKYHIPAYMEHGEALYTGNEKYGNKKLKKELSGLKGVIAVSNQNKDYVVKSGIVEKEITEVYPNCFREERFYKIDKKEARNHFGWDENQFIVGYVGSLDDRKGVLRLEEAVNKLDNVDFACAGKGDKHPNGDRCIWAKPVLHEELVYFYNALDAFVLPTLAEGSCTATAEAIGCGCPIISSNRAFNENLCDKSNSILIEPDDVDDIAQAIKRVYDNPQLLEQMSKGSIEKSKTLIQSKRMKKIEEFMEKTARENQNIGGRLDESNS